MIGKRPVNRSRRRGYGLSETAISVVIVSGMMIAALNAAGASRLAQRVGNDTSKGAMLAAGLMREILEQKYTEPTETPVSLGLEVTELIAANRTVYDDVDDYDGVSNSPPKSRDGTDVPNCTGWTRSVSVVFVDPTNLSTTSITDTGV